MRRRAFEYFEVRSASPQDLEIFTQRRAFSSTGPRRLAELEPSGPIAELLGEQETSAFLRDAWGRKPFLFRSRKRTRRFAGYFRAGALGRGRFTPRVHEAHAGLGRLAKQFEDWVGSPTSIDLFVSGPTTAEESRWHWDPFDKFLIQLEGSGGLELYESIGCDLLRGHTTPAFPQHSEHTAIKRADVMRSPGDVLYIPSGTPHRHVITAKRSVFAPVWIAPVTWHDVLTRAVEHALRACENDLRFRQRVEPGSLDPARFAELTRSFAEHIDDELLDYCYHAVRIARDSAGVSDARAHRRSKACLAAHSDHCKLVRTHRKYFLHRRFGAWELVVHGKKVYLDPSNAAKLRTLLDRPTIDRADLAKVHYTRAGRREVMKLLVESRLFSAAPPRRTAWKR